MSQIPEAFMGHDLTGWTVYVIKGDYGISRWTADGTDISIEQQYDGNFVLFEADHSRYKGTLGECLSQAGILVHNDLAPVPYGGWAPAPIGYSADPGWQPIEILPDEMKQEEETFFGFAPVAEWLHIRGVMRFSQEENEFVVVNFGAAWDTICKPTHWKLMLQPPQEGQG